MLLVYVIDDYVAKDELDLMSEDRRRRDRRFPMISLKRYSESPFAVLFASGDEQALLNACAVDHCTFRELLDMFKPVYHTHTVDKATGLIWKKKITNLLEDKESLICWCACLGTLLVQDSWTLCQDHCMVFRLDRNSNVQVGEVLSQGPPFCLATSS